MLVDLQMETKPYDNGLDETPHPLLELILEDAKLESVIEQQKHMDETLRRDWEIDVRKRLVSDVRTLKLPVFYRDLGKPIFDVGECSLFDDAFDDEWVRVKDFK